MNKVTKILRAAESGEAAENVTEKLLPLIYEELRRLAAHQMAGHHNGADGLSFADGHAEIHKYLDLRTKPAPRWDRGTAVLQFNVASPNNPDIAWLQERTSARTQP